MHPDDPRTQALVAHPSEPVTHRPRPSTSPHPAASSAFVLRVPLSCLASGLEPMPAARRRTPPLLPRSPA